jgi:hypothetical protein
MNTDPESFEALRKLMALKRHELPPPGYFTYLSEKIATRIQRGEGKLNLVERVYAALVLRPALAGACIVAVGTVLSLTAAYSVNTAQDDASVESPHATWRNAAPSEAFATRIDSTQPLHVPNWVGSTNPGVPAAELPSLFAPVAQAVPVSFEPGR